MQVLKIEKLIKGDTGQLLKQIQDTKPYMPSL